jgi:sulfite exporter TauE/SafE
MCGPIATFVAQSGKLRSYHLARGLGYITLGILGGSLGNFFLQSNFYWIRLISGIFLAATILCMGLNLFLWRKSIQVIQPSFMNRYFSKNSSSFALGLLSMFLPCGWLYTYVLAATASQSPYSGALVMLLFWLGTIPALSAFPVFARKAISLSNKAKQKIAGGILISASIYALISFYFLY